MIIVRRYFVVRIERWMLKFTLLSKDDILKNKIKNSCRHFFFVFLSAKMGDSDEKIGTFYCFKHFIKRKDVT